MDRRRREEDGASEGEGNGRIFIWRCRSGIISSGATEQRSNKYSFKITAFTYDVSHFIYMSERFNAKIFKNYAKSSGTKEKETDKVNRRFMPRAKTSNEIELRVRKLDEVTN